MKQLFPNDINPYEQELNDSRKMSSEYAATVLTAVIAHHESKITDIIDLHNIGGYDGDTIRNAYVVAGLDVIKYFHGIWNTPEIQEIVDWNPCARAIGCLDALKQTSEGLLRFSLYRQGRYKDHDVRNEFEWYPSRVRMSLMRNFDTTNDWGYALEAEIPLEDNEYEYDQPSDLIQWDKKLGEKHMGELRLVKDRRLRVFRANVRGMRWMAANLLSWQTADVILPNQLDNPMLSR